MKLIHLYRVTLTGLLLCALSAYGQQGSNNVEHGAPARGEPLASALDERAEPPVARSAPFTPKVFSLLAVLSLDEKLSLVHGAADPTQLGNAGYLPGVPRLGIPPRRDADAFGIQVAAYATAAPTRLGLGATFDLKPVLAWGQVAGNEIPALGVD